MKKAGLQSELKDGFDLDKERGKKRRVGECSKIRLSILNWEI